MTAIADQGIANRSWASFRQDKKRIPRRQRPLVEMSLILPRRFKIFKIPECLGFSSCFERSVMFVQQKPKRDAIQ